MSLVSNGQRKKASQVLSELIESAQNDPLYAQELYGGLRQLAQMLDDHQARNPGGDALLNPQVVELQAQVDQLTRALGEVRDAFDAPEAGSILDAYWIDAMSDPLGVPAYVRAQAQAINSERKTQYNKPKKEQFKHF